MAEECGKSMASSNTIKREEKEEVEEGKATEGMYIYIYIYIYIYVYIYINISI